MEESSFNVKNINDLKDFINNNDQVNNYHYFSKFPECCKNDPCILGIDEAGRGPVFGPMVYGIVCCPKSRTEDLANLKCADSKTLKEKDREELFEKLVDVSTQEWLGWCVEFLSPDFISRNMLSRKKITLNEIAMNSTIKLLESIISLGIKVEEVYVDTIGPPEKYETNLTNRFEQKIKFFVRKKADSLYPIVSAASICAKVCRDMALNEWKFPKDDPNFTKDDFGSGYTSDKLVHKFLKDNCDPIFGFDKMVRFSWSTSEKVLNDIGVPVIWPKDNDASSSAKKQKKPAVKSAKITSFFVKKSDNFSKPNFYTENGILIAENF